MNCVICNINNCRHIKKPYAFYLAKLLIIKQAINTTYFLCSRLGNSLLLDNDMRALLNTIKENAISNQSLIDKLYNNINDKYKKE